MGWIRRVDLSLFFRPRSQNLGKKAFLAIYAEIFFISSRKRWDLFRELLLDLCLVDRVVEGGVTKEAP